MATAALPLEVPAHHRWPASPGAAKTSATGGHCRRRTRGPRFGVLDDSRLRGNLAVLRPVFGRWAKQAGASTNATDFVGLVGMAGCIRDRRRDVSRFARISAGGGVGNFSGTGLRQTDGLNRCAWRPGRAARWLALVGGWGVQNILQTLAVLLLGVTDDGLALLDQANDVRAAGVLVGGAGRVRLLRLLGGWIRGGGGSNVYTEHRRCRILAILIA